MLTVWDWQKKSKIAEIKVRAPFFESFGSHLNYHHSLPLLSSPFLCYFVLDVFALIFFPPSPFFSVILIVFQMTSFSSFYVVPCLFHFVPVSLHIPLCFSSLCSSCNDFANVLFLLDNQWSGLSGGVSPDWRQYHCHMWEIPYLLLDLERFLTHPQTRHLWRKDTRA